MDKGIVSLYHLTLWVINDPGMACRNSLIALPLEILVENHLLLLVKQLKDGRKSLDLTKGVQYQPEVVCLLVHPVRIYRLVNDFLTDVITLHKSLFHGIDGVLICLALLPWEIIIVVFDRVLKVFQLEEVM